MARRYDGDAVLVKLFRAWGGHLGTEYGQPACTGVDYDGIIAMSNDKLGNILAGWRALASDEEVEHMIGMDKTKARVFERMQ